MDEQFRQQQLHRNTKLDQENNHTQKEPAAHHEKGITAFLSRTYCRDSHANIINRISSY